MPISVVPQRIKIISSSTEPVFTQAGDQDQLEDVVEVGERINKQLEQITGLEIDKGDM